jgi:IS605 OrfB family transposase
MKLIARLALLPDADQHRQLLVTLERANAAANFISRAAWEARTFPKYNLQKIVYTQVRHEFGLSANMTIRVICKVSDAYRLDRNRLRTFSPHGAIAYDEQIVAYRMRDITVSIQVLGGRIRLPFTCGDRARALLATQHGESDLIYRDGRFYLFAPCDVEEPTADDAQEFLGVDLGVTNVAVTSDGTIHGGGHLKNIRYRHRRLRARLQRKGTKSAKRCLRRLSGKERRFARNTNHVISKRIVATAKGTARGIALEDLTHIRSRITVRHGRQRVTLHSWAFDQLRQYIQYKSRLAGVPVVVVDPRNTSRTCPSCGCVDKANRKTQASFLCISCGFAGHADAIAAGVIASRAPLNEPNAGGMYHRAAPLLASLSL